MKTLISPLLLVLALTSCANNQQATLELKTAQVKMLTEGMAACKDDSGCKVALTAFVFGGGLDMPQEAGPVQYAAAFLPYANLFLQAYGMTLGGGGSASAMYVKGSNNTFIGWNRTSADRSSSVRADFGVDMTSYFNNKYYSQTGGDGASTLGDTQSP